MPTVYYDSSATGAGDGTSEADAYTDLQTALNSLSAGDHLYCKRAASREGVKTTNLTFTTSPTNTGDPTIIEGYETTPGDGGMYQTASPVFFTGEHIILAYFDVDKDDDSTHAISLGGDGSVAYRCKATSTYGFGNCFNLTDSVAIECSSYAVCGNAGDGCFEGSRFQLINCYAEITDGNDGAAVSFNSGFRQHSLIDCLFVNSGPGLNNDGVRIQGSTNSTGVFIHNCTFYNFGGNGIIDTDGVGNATTQPSIYYGNLFYNCGNGIVNAQGVNVNTLAMYAASNAFGSITSNQVSNISSNFDPITLTASPFEDTTDFQINDTSGGGASIRGLRGVPDVKDFESDVRVEFGTHGGVIPNPNIVFQTFDEGSLFLGTGDVGDTVTVSGRSFQKVDDDPIVWRRTTV